MLAAWWLAIVLFGVLDFKLVHDTDIFWQVKLGQIMLHERRIPLQDRLTYTHAGEPTPPIGWLAQGLFAAFYGIGDWHLARAVHHVALVGSLLLAAATCRRQMTSAFSVVIAMTIAFVTMLSNADLRPQSLGLLSFAAILALARSRQSVMAKLCIAVPMFVAWQNIHPSVSVGLVALGGLYAAEWLHRGGDPCSRWELITLVFLMTAAQVATPVGAGIFNVSRTNLQIGREYLRIPEWMSPWECSVVETVAVYWLVLFGTVISIICLWNRVAARDRGLFVAMTILSLTAARFIIFWSVALVPLWAEILEQVVPKNLFVWARGQSTLTTRVRRCMIVLLGGAAAFVGLHPARFKPIVHPDIPLDGVLTLRAELPAKARIYNDYVWAGPLLLQGSEGWRVSVDGRLYCFPAHAEWQAIDDARAGRVPLEVIEQTHRPDAFFLYKGRDRALIESLSASPRWRACFNRPNCVAFVRAR
jgi:hypothetical protein